MQNPPAPTAQGSFTKTPFPHLLVYALERRLTGTFELFAGGQSAATLVVIGGAPAKLRTTDGVHYLGEVLLELGLVDQAQLAASLARLQESPRLQGEILKEMGAVDDAKLDLGVRAQLDRKLEHLFTLPAETEFAFYEAADGLARYGGAPTPIDPLPVLWRGIRQRPQWEHVDATLRRVGNAAVRIGPASQVDRFQFGRAEAAAVELLRQRTMRVVDLAATKVVGPSVAQLLVYTLVITKQVEVVETASIRPPPRPAAPVPPPPVSSQPLSGQAFARVQLQARPVQRAPLVVEEVAPVASLGDGRIASPLPQPYPAAEAADGAAPPREGSASDLGALISATIQSSIPPPVEAGYAPAPTPPMAFAPPVPAPPTAVAIPPPPTPSSPPMPLVPPAAPSSSAIAAATPSAPAMPAAPPSAPASNRELTSEQNALKQKILERAAGITAQNYFEMLGVPQDAPIDVVQKTFITLAKVWHPDRLPGALADVKDACSKVFSHLTEAHATLTDAARRADYMTLLKEGGATPDEQAQVQAVLEAATEFQKAEFHVKRNDVQKAYELVKRAYDLDPAQADYLALMAWLEAQRSENLGREKTLEKVGVLDRALKQNPNCERAYFYRAMLYKRIEEPKKAYQDFKKAMELNPRNLDAAREVRLHRMRGGGSLPPGATASSPGTRTSKSPPPAEGLGGLFGKLFKK